MKEIHKIKIRRDVTWAREGSQPCVHTIGWFKVLLCRVSHVVSAQHAPPLDTHALVWTLVFLINLIFI